MDRLEDLTEPIFGDGAACQGWKPVMDYVSAAEKQVSEDNFKFMVEKS